MLNEEGPLSRHRLEVLMLEIYWRLNESGATILIPAKILLHSVSIIFLAFSNKTLDFFLLANHGK